MKIKRLYPIGAIGVAFIIGAIIIACMGKNPFDAYYAIFIGVFKSKHDIAAVLLHATPLLFSGAAMAFAFRAGLFNIGVQGQMIAGGLVAAAMGAFAVSPFFHNVVIAMLIAGCAGMIWAGIAGLLKARFGAHEVITTIMLNYIAASLEIYLLNTSMKEGGIHGLSPQTPPIVDSARLVSIFPPTTVNIGLVAGVVVVVLLWFVMEKTVLGYEIRAVGKNGHAAKNAGISTSRSIIFVMLISGFVAGLGGAERVLGGINQDRYILGSMAEYGFDGIAVALLGKNHPLSIVGAAFLFGILRAGAMNMQFEMGIPNQISVILQALIIVFVVAENGFEILKVGMKKLFSEKKAL